MCLNDANVGGFRLLSPDRRFGRMGLGKAVKWELPVEATGRVQTVTNLDRRDNFCPQKAGNVCVAFPRTPARLTGSVKAR